MSKVTNANGKLGWIVSWRVPKEVGLQHLRDSLTAAGFDAGLARDLFPAKALRRAFADMDTSRVIRQLRKEGSMLYFQLTREHLDSHLATYAKETELCLDVDKATITADNSAVRDEAMRLFSEHLGKRTTYDMTLMVKKIFEEFQADLVPVREQGFVYFVPHHHQELVEKVRSLLEMIGGKLQTFAVRMGFDSDAVAPGSTETQEVDHTSECVAESMVDYFAGLCKEFKDTCDGLHEKTGDFVRERRMVAIGKLREKMECYRGLLSGMADRVGQQIDEAEKSMLEMLTRPAPEDLAATEVQSESEAVLV